MSEIRKKIFEMLKKLGITQEDVEGIKRKLEEDAEGLKKKLGITQEDVEGLKKNLSILSESRRSDFEQLREKFSLTEKEIEVLEKISEQYKDKWK